VVPFSQRSIVGQIEFWADEKLRTRFERTRAKLERAIQRLPHIVIYSNSDLANPYKLVELYDDGQRKFGS